MKKPELLIPAGSLETLRTAIIYGADAIYMGGQQFGLRAKAKNFTLDQMKQGIEEAHQQKVKVYITANIIAHNEDIEEVYSYFKDLKTLEPDAVIIADPGMLAVAQEVMPEMELHLSTQANNTNYMSAAFWHKNGIKRIVVARELSFKEIQEIHDKTPKTLDIEAFVHGAMCISYSGRCLLSNYMTGRDANKGACTHPCRWRYHLVEETRPGEYMPIEENKRGTYIYNSKDLCMIGHIPDIIHAGIKSLKIEGRMKTALYVATVTRAYRRAIDDYFEDEEKYRRNIDSYLEEVQKCTHRQFTTGFYYNKPSGQDQIYDSNTYIRNYTFVGKVLSYDIEHQIVKLQQRNKFIVGDTLEAMQDGGNILLQVKEMWNEEGEHVESAPHPKQVITLRSDIPLRKGTIIRKKENF